MTHVPHIGEPGYRSRYGLTGAASGRRAPRWRFWAGSCAWWCFVATLVGYVQWHEVEPFLRAVLP